MLRKYIEFRERQAYEADNSRQSLPFGWGEEFLGISVSDTPYESVHRFSTKALRSSEEFFAHEPSTAYNLKDQLLTFPSSITTDISENNTVWGRVFEADSEMAVVVLPQWNCNWEGHVKLCRILQRNGIASVRLSLPYHHFRAPAHPKRPEYVISPNIGQTLQASRQGVLDARRTVDWLIARGYKKIGILGSSLGSCIAFLTFAHDERVSAGVFIHVSGYFADVVWRGLSTRHVRRSLEGSVKEHELRELWAPISPMPYIRRLRGTTKDILMFAGRYDPTFLPELSQQAFQEFDRHEIPYELHWLNCGHYTMAQLPFSAVVVHRVLRFLKATRDRS
jgi:pimeloyl-ACP methyl ester carboxylesterase